MWKVADYICILLLFIVSVIDIRNREIPCYLLWIAAAASVIYHFAMCEQNIILILGGIIIGLCFLIISKVTREGLGYGDSYGILILGIYLGMWNLLTVLATSFFLLISVSIFFLWMRKMNRKISLPFYPFLTGGYLVFLLMGG